MSMSTHQYQIIINIGGIILLAQLSTETLVSSSWDWEAILILVSVNFGFTTYVNNFVLFHLSTSYVVEHHNEQRSQFRVAIWSLRFSRICLIFSSSGHRSFDVSARNSWPTKSSIWMRTEKGRHRPQLLWTGLGYQEILFLHNWLWLQSWNARDMSGCTVLDKIMETLKQFEAEYRK